MNRWEVALIRHHVPRRKRAATVKATTPAWGGVLVAPRPVFLRQGEREMNQTQRAAAMGKLDKAKSDLSDAEMDVENSKEDLRMAEDRVRGCDDEVRKCEEKFPECRRWACRHAKQS